MNSSTLRDQGDVPSRGLTVEVWPLEVNQPREVPSLWPAGPALPLGITHVGPKLSPTCAGRKSCWTASW